MSEPRLDRTPEDLCPACHGPYGECHACHQPLGVNWVEGHPELSPRPNGDPVECVGHMCLTWGCPNGGP